MNLSRVFWANEVLEIEDGASGFARGIFLGLFLSARLASFRPMDINKVHSVLFYDTQWGSELKLYVKD